MIDTSVAIALTALFISALSLIFSIFSYFRDRSRLIAWSEIIFHVEGPWDSPKDVPVLHVSVMNAGRRPLLIRNLCMRSGKSRWWTSVKEAEASTDPNKDLLGFLDEIKRNRVAQLSSVRLNEGVVFERMFTVNDCSSFIHLHADPIATAEELCIEDVQGKRYKVRNSRQNLEKMMEAWSASNS